MYSRKETYGKLLTIITVLVALIAVMILVLCIDIMKLRINETAKANDIVETEHTEVMEVIEEPEQIEETNIVYLPEPEVEKIADPVVVEEEPKDILQEAGEKYDIDPKLLEAIERLESGHYTSELYKNKNNTWGAFDGKEWLSFSSREESTMTLAKNLRLYYFDQGLDTLEEIGSKYCPDDPEWANKVREIYNEL